MTVSCFHHRYICAESNSFKNGIQTNPYKNIIKVFLRLYVAISFLCTVAEKMLYIEYEFTFDPRNESQVVIKNMFAWGRLYSFMIL